MMRNTPNLRCTLAPVLGLCLLACGRGDASRTPVQDSVIVRAPSPPALVDTITARPAGLACFSPDSGGLVFGQVTVAQEDGDASGVSFTFQVTLSGMIGSVVDARGEAPPPKRLQGLRYDAASDTLAFWYASSTNTRYIYSMRLSCDSLSGVATLFVTDTDPGQREKRTFRRMR